jgi:hypothetical protein
MRVAEISHEEDISLNSNFLFAEMSSSSKVADYLLNNDLHSFTRRWLEQDKGGLDDEDAFQLIDRNLHLLVETKFEQCISSRPAKNSVQAVVASGRALQLSEVNRAIATCEYANGRDEPGEHLIACLMNRLE